MMKYLILSIIIFVFLCSAEKIAGEGFDTNLSVQEKDSLITISVSIVGDIMCHSVQYKYARVSADSFNFDPAFSVISKYLSGSDFLFGNFETVTAGKNVGYSGYPYFNTPDEFITALRHTGFDLLTTANNHAIDRGEKGIRRTIEHIKLNHLRYNGTFLSERDRDSIRILNIKGIKIAFLAYSYGTNGNPIPKGKKYLVNLIDTVQIRKDINLAREEGTDIVLVHFHFGDEYKRLPNNYQKEIVKKTVESGADIIVGGHTHVLQPIEYFKTKNAGLDSGFVIYSMGNFISNQRWRYSDGGAVLTFSLTRNATKDSIYLNNVDYLPIWVFKGETKRGREYIIIPSEAAFYDSLYDFLTPQDRRLAAQSFHDTNEILTKYSNEPHLRNIYPGIIYGLEHLSFH
jgi:poly-gamma-glutamate capsule biosynthesis protein CapA/YwtB (metallophosphatase superfamily)